MTTQERLNLIEDFIDFASSHLKIEELPKMTFISDKSWVLARHSFGEYNNQSRSIVMYIANRNLADVLRTLGHELTHHRQNELGLLYTKSGETGSPVEDEANIVAGILMREFGKRNELIYEGVRAEFLRLLLEEEDSSYSLDPASHRRPKEEKEKKYIAAINKKIAEYIKNGSKGDLDLVGTPITKLPNNLKVVKGNLRLTHSKITKLPNDLKIGGTLYLSYTPITELPSGLDVKKDLVLSNCEITELPNDLKVEGDLYLYKTKISKKYAKKYTRIQIKQMCPGIKGNIYK